MIAPANIDSVFTPALDRSLSLAGHVPGEFGRRLQGALGSREVAQALPRAAQEGAGATAETETAAEGGDEKEEAGDTAAVVVPLTMEVIAEAILTGKPVGHDAVKPEHPDSRPQADNRRATKAQPDDPAAPAARSAGSTDGRRAPERPVASDDPPHQTAETVRQAEAGTGADRPALAPDALQTADEAEVRAAQASASAGQNRGAAAQAVAQVVAPSLRQDVERLTSAASVRVEAIDAVKAAGATRAVEGGNGSQSAQQDASGMKQGPGARSAEGQDLRAQEQKQLFQAQVSRGLASALRHGTGAGGSSAVTIRLTPEALGPMRIELSMKPDGVTATFEVRSGEARELLQESMASLRESLEARGLQVRHLHIDQRAESDAAREAPVDPEAGTRGQDAGGERGDARQEHGRDDAGGAARGTSRWASESADESGGEAHDAADGARTLTLGLDAIA